MDQKIRAQRLAAYGCLPEKATCVHKVYHGDKTDPGKPATGRTFCQLAYDHTGAQRDMYFIDPSYAHQPLDHLKALWADELRAPGGVALSEAEQIEAELAAENQRLAEAKRRVEDNARALDAKKRLDAARRERAELEHTASVG